MTATPSLREALHAALSHIRWNSFGECRSPGWDVAPPTAAEADALIVSALARLDVEPDNTSPLCDFQEGQWWVAEMDAFASGQTSSNDQKRAVAVVHHLLRAIELYSEPNPAERKPLTDEQCQRVIDSMPSYDNWGRPDKNGGVNLHELARAIEQAHNINE